MHYAIHHKTVYHYEDNVSYSHHLARLAPLDSTTQTHLSSRLVIDPAPEILTSHRDYYGNTTSFFSLSSPHRSLTIESHARVSLLSNPPSGLDLSPHWETVQSSPCRVSLSISAFLKSLVWLP